MPLRLHAITPADTVSDGPSNSGGQARASGVAAIPQAPPIEWSHVEFRELSAVVTNQQTFAAWETTPETIASHRAIVDSAFKHGTVLPAPIGVVFRSRDVLLRWMELHYVSLTGALAFLDDRAAARVHIVRNDGRQDELEPDADLSSQATEAARALRRRAAAGVPLRTEHRPGQGLELGASFLVDCPVWKDFLAAVAEQQDAHHLLRFHVTGPWAPYDFVRMQFGG